jgi:hypothetical protein
MTMKHYLSGYSIRSIPGTIYSRDFSAISDMSFSNAPNVFTDVETETSYGSGTYEAISQVRVASVFDISTGQNLGDDFKRFIFESTFVPTIGQLFYWKNSYWIATNSDNYQSLSKSLVVRRCNNMLRWYDEYKNLIEEPCILSYVLKEAGDYSTSQMMISSGFITVYCQRNPRTVTVVENNRFLFGVPTNRKAYKVYGNGLKIYLNSETEDETSPAVAEFYMGASFLNSEIDDLVNGIANAYDNEYTVTILDGDIIQSMGFTKTLTATVKHEGAVVSEGVTWSSSDSSIVSVTSAGVITCNQNEDFGLVSVPYSISEDFGSIFDLHSESEDFGGLIYLASATIRCTLNSNTDIYDEITVYVTSDVQDDYEVQISPDVTLLYEGDTQAYTCYLMKNGVETANKFTFAASGVPAANYILTTINDNAFTVENVKKYVDDELSITCTSGTHTKTFDITLRGDW